MATKSVYYTNKEVHVVEQKVGGLDWGKWAEDMQQGGTPHQLAELREGRQGSRWEDNMVHWHPHHEGGTLHQLLGEGRQGPQGGMETSLGLSL